MPDIIQMRPLTPEELAGFKRALREQGNAPLVPVTDWMPIDTAPQDGTPVLLGFPKNLHAQVGHCEYGVWGALNFDFSFTRYVTQPTHWQPLPAPPRSL